MKITVNHDNCQHSDAFASRCLAATIRNPLGHERYCMAQLEEDGQPELTLTLIVDGQTYTLVLGTDPEQNVGAVEEYLASTV
jgi:hypothetical protein